MASMAEPPSGSGFDVALVLAHLSEQVLLVEEAWEGEVRVSEEGKERMAAFAASVVASLNERGLPDGVDARNVERQLAKLVPDFLEQLRREAEADGILTTVGYAEISATLIERRLTGFVAARCLCWPQ